MEIKEVIKSQAKSNPLFSALSCFTLLLCLTSTITGGISYGFAMKQDKSESDKKTSTDTLIVSIVTGILFLSFISSTFVSKDNCYN